MARKPVETNAAYEAKALTFEVERNCAECSQIHPSWVEGAFQAAAAQAAAQFNGQIASTENPDALLKFIAPLPTAEESAAGENQATMRARYGIRVKFEFFYPSYATDQE